MKTKTPTTLSIAEFAETVGVAPRTARDLIARGIIKREGAGLAPGAVRAYCDSLRSAASGRGGEAAAEVALHRGALLKIQRQRAEFEFALTRKEYGRWDEFCEEHHRVVRGVSVAVMSIPNRMAAYIGLSREASIELKEELRRILTELGSTPFATVYDAEYHRLQENLNNG